MIGSTLGAYRLVQRLGEGGMGEVWAAEHVRLGRRAAIKLLHPAFAHRADIVARFFNEARAATEIADPGIVQIFDFGQHDGTAYIVMELLDGEGLDRRLARQGVLDPASAVRVVRQVATSLAAAHARGIVHRDLKPENVFLVRDPAVAGGERAKLLDFGIAKLGGDLGPSVTRTAAVLGTPMYMAPEQCRGAGQVDHRADLYSLGCVLMALLTGRSPFDGVGMGEQIAAHLLEAPPAPSSRVPGLPPALDQLVLRCLAKDPADRPASARALAAELDQLLGRAEVTAPITIPPNLARTIVAHTTLSSATGAQLPVAPRRPAWPIAVALVGALALVATLRLTRAEPAVAPTVPSVVTPAAPVVIAPIAPVAIAPVAPTPSIAPTPIATLVDELFLYHAPRPVIRRPEPAVIDDDGDGIPDQR